jgi:hypothetical protein
VIFATYVNALKNMPSCNFYATDPTETGLDSNLGFHSEILVTTLPEPSRGPSMTYDFWDIKMTLPIHIEISTILLIVYTPKRGGPGSILGSLHVGFVVDKVALGQVFPRVLRFSPVNFIPPVLHYYEKDKKNILLNIIGL